MAGRIRDDDIAEVRDKARIDEVVSDYVTLRKAGGGSLKGLCPFHDEKSPSFHVTPSRGFYHCFGCQEGGDVITFLMKVDGLGFGEAVERLADRVGVELRREDGPASDRPRGPARGRLMEANAAAQEFYAEQLGGTQARRAREFLTSRGFDQEAAHHFGVGFAPRGGELLLRHLRGRRFSEEELLAAGLLAQSGSGSAYDRFRGRLVWPIREPNADTIGFGARRIFEDDRIEAKYLNTPETAIYKKSLVLYGIDLARDAIRNGRQAVVVEGYTDVMACHLAGVTTAIASCGTAFGADHARVLKRFLDTHGEVVFTFDGDEAGQRAAMKVFTDVQDLAPQSYVAVAPAGQDPCDLRLAEGDASLRELVATRRPLYRFALSTVLARYDLDRADARVDALREAAVVVAAVQDRGKVDAFAREIAGMIGVEVEEARAEVRRAVARPAPDQRGGERRAADRGVERGPAGEAVLAPTRDLPRLDDPRFAIERETLKLVVQFPAAVMRATAHVSSADFTHPTFQGVWEAASVVGGPRAGAEDPGWAIKIRDAAVGDPAVSAAISELGVEPLKTIGEPSPAYVVGHVYRLQELTTTRRIDELKTRLQRTNPVEQAADYNRMFGELVALEAHRRTLRDHQAGVG